MIREDAPTVGDLLGETDNVALKKTFGSMESLLDKENYFAVEAVSCAM